MPGTEAVREKPSQHAVSIFHFDEFEECFDLKPFSSFSADRIERLMVGM
jgi:hypothetical protein